MTVSIHQPNYIPWIGYFDKIRKSDIFVILDNVQFEKNGFTNRNKIKTGQNPVWLTIPIDLSNHLTNTIKDVRVANIKNWKRKNLNTLKMNYSRTQFFDEVFELYESSLNKEFKYLIELNIELITKINDYLNIQTTIRFASEIENDLSSSELILEICKKLNTTTYLSGTGSIKYLDSDIFIENKINIVQNQVLINSYPQLWGDFVPNLSILDLLFNCGKNSINYF